MCIIYVYFAQMMQDLQVQIDMWELQARVLRIRFIEFLAKLPRCHVPPWCRAAVAHLLCGAVPWPWETMMGQSMTGTYWDH